MRVVGRSVLYDFCKRHPECRTWIENWVSDVSERHWNSLNDLKARYPSASILANNVIIFNVKGNGYRLVVQVALAVQVLAVKWAGTHSEYSRRRF